MMMAPDFMMPTQRWLAERANSIAREGYFENLTQYVGAGFYLTVGVKAICPKDYSDGGVFLYTKVEQEAIRRVNFRGKVKGGEFHGDGGLSV